MSAKYFERKEEIPSNPVKELDLSSLSFFFIISGKNDTLDVWVCIVFIEIYPEVVI